MNLEGGGCHWQNVGLEDSESDICTLKREVITDSPIMFLKWLYLNSKPLDVQITVSKKLMEMRMNDREGARVKIRNVLERGVDFTVMSDVFPGTCSSNTWK